MIEAQDQLLSLLGEELKQPLVAIAQLAELQSSQDISIQARRALRTIDNVLLYRRVTSGQIELELEPVHVGSAIQEVQQRMKPLIFQQGCKVELHISNSLQPVDVDRRLLTGVVESLWQAVVAIVPSQSILQCYAKKTKKGIRVSLGCASATFEDVHFKRANSESSQPLTAFAGPSTDFITAQQLCRLLGAEITKSTQGIGVTFTPSRQLQMV
jgi:hypothetical protein